MMYVGEETRVVADDKESKLTGGSVVVECRCHDDAEIEISPLVPFLAPLLRNLWSSNSGSHHKMHAEGVCLILSMWRCGVAIWALIWELRDGGCYDLAARQEPPKKHIMTEEIAGTDATISLANRRS